jgi:hypothetical protein
MAQLIRTKEKMADELKQTMTNDDLMRSLKTAILKGDL